jgi:hypothetical protein
MQLTKLFTVVMAGSAVVSALPTGAAPADVAQLGQAAESYVNGLVNLMANDPNLRIRLAPNDTKPAAGKFKPNVEGAIIGGAVVAQLGALIGALLGSFTTWSFSGFQKGLTDLVGFNPAGALAALPGANSATGSTLPPLPPGLGGLVAPNPTAAPSPTKLIPAPTAAPTSAPMPGGHSHGMRL